MHAKTLCIFIQHIHTHIVQNKREKYLEGKLLLLQGTDLYIILRFGFDLDLILVSNRRWSGSLTVQVLFPYLSLLLRFNIQH
jgi:hypothetical protein